MVMFTFSELKQLGLLLVVLKDSHDQDGDALQQEDYTELKERDTPIRKFVAITANTEGQKSVKCMPLTS